MPQNNDISNEPGRYDRARVQLLRPVEAAVRKLGLPLIRERKVGTILNALEMQIEDGSDSPEVNRLLLDALANLYSRFFTASSISFLICGGSRYSPRMLISMRLSRW